MVITKTSFKENKLDAIAYKMAQKRDVETNAEGMQRGIETMRKGWKGVAMAAATVVEVRAAETEVAEWCMTYRRRPRSLRCKVRR